MMLESKKAQISIVPALNAQEIRSRISITVDGVTSQERVILIVPPGERQDLALHFCWDSDRM